MLTDVLCKCGGEVGRDFFPNAFLWRLSLTPRTLHTQNPFQGSLHFLIS